MTSHSTTDGKDGINPVNRTVSAALVFTPASRHPSVNNIALSALASSGDHKALASLSTPVRLAVLSHPRSRFVDVEADASDMEDDAESDTGSDISDLVDDSGSPRSNHAFGCRCSLCPDLSPDPSPLTVPIPVTDQTVNTQIESYLSQPTLYSFFNEPIASVNLPCSHFNSSQQRCNQCANCIRLYDLARQFNSSN